MKRFIIDTGALSLFFLGDKRVSPYFQQLQDGLAEGFMTSVNLAEFFYKVCQRLGRETAILWCHQTRTILSIVETNESLTQKAGLEKCRKSTFSLADSFALALAREIKGTLLTTDSELEKVRDIDAKFFGV